VKFSKFHTLGNISYRRSGRGREFSDFAGLAGYVRTAHRRRADGILLISVKNAPQGEVSFRIFNADGSEAGSPATACAGAAPTSSPRAGSTVTRPSS